MTVIVEITYNAYASGVIGAINIHATRDFAHVDELQPTRQT